MSNKDTIIKRNLFFGLMIIGIILIPMALAYAVFQSGWWMPLGTTNKGTLLNMPVSVHDLILTNDERVLKRLFVEESAHKRWRLLVPVSTPCDDVCQKNLYTTRQVHIRLAEKAYRVERIFLVLGDLSDQEQRILKQQHPNVIYAQTTPQQLSTWLGANNSEANPANSYYLMDQEGFAMMRYNTTNTGQDLLDDIKKLLKFTYDK